MDERRDGADRRVFTRYSMRKGVEIRDGGRRREGRLQDISGGGAAIQTDAGDELLDETLAEGRHVGIDVEDMGYYGAEVIRDLEEGYAVRFEMDDAERDELVTEIMQHGIALDD